MKKCIVCGCDISRYNKNKEFCFLHKAQEVVIVRLERMDNIALATARAMERKRKSKNGKEVQKNE